MARCNPAPRRFALRVMVVLAACRVPADPEGTTERVSGQTLRVGVLQDPLEPADAAAVTRVAAALDAETTLVTHDPHTLVAMLEEGRIELLAGRLPGDTPFSSQIAVSAPFATLTLGKERKDRVLGLRKGENRFLTRVNQALKAQPE